MTTDEVEAQLVLPGRVSQQSINRQSTVNHRRKISDYCMICDAACEGQAGHPQNRKLGVGIGIAVGIGYWENGMGSGRHSPSQLHRA